MTATFGTMLRQFRQDAGLSQPVLARHAHISQSTLSRYETGLQAVEPDIAARLDELLHANGALLALLPSVDPEDTAIGHEQTALLRETAAFIYDTTPDLAATIAEHTHQFQRLDDYVGGRELYAAIRRILDAADHACRDEPVALPNLSELGQIGGWIASDAGKRDTATRHYLDAAKAAHEADRRDLGASALSSLSYQMANADNMADRAEAVLLASSVATRAEGIGRALLLDRLAWAHARVGDAEGALRILDQVDEVFTGATEPAPSWAYWLDQDEITVMRGRCMVELNQPGAAIDLLGAALDRYDPNRARERGLYTTYLAEALVKAGDTTEARRLLESTPDAKSARLDERLHILS
ncbi:helix-turn-helix domain-containing protein [Amycolatopsis pigmentata]|uniref:Helix-turn-helix domain-containing protein n=1 Tax=Amycolatopsis pigmentata TaxID=450801 RepID=A0ABW5FZG8_9PSEU